MRKILIATATTSAVFAAVGAPDGGGRLEATALHPRVGWTVSRRKPFCQRKPCATCEALAASGPLRQWHQDLQPVKDTYWLKGFYEAKDGWAKLTESVTLMH